MQDEILSEVLEWSEERPGWQRDALRRLFMKGVIAEVDLDELVELCKAARGLSDPRDPQVLTKEHLSIKGGDTDPVSLMSLTHHLGVNALAPEQTIAFGPNLSIVYGQNAAGKSGYARILKRACRSRSAEEILGNVLSEEKPLTAKATIRYRAGTKEASVNWTLAAPVDELAAVSVFDARSAPVYLRDKTDVAFRPFGLDIFDKLSIACNEVRGRIETQRLQLISAIPIIPSFPEGTRAKSLVDNLSPLTNVDDVRALAALSKDEKRRLKELQVQERDLRAADPEKRKQELVLKAKRIDLAADHVANLATVFGDAALAKLRSAADSLRAAQETLSLLRKTTLTPDLLTGTGEQTWRRMWEASSEFSEIAYPDSGFPYLSDGARCLFCQQSIGADASERLRHFQEYVSSSAQAEVRKAEATYDSTFGTAIQTAVERNDVDLAISELAADESDLAQQVRNFLQEAARIQKEIKLSTESKYFPTDGLSTTPESDLRSISVALRKRASQIPAKSSDIDPKLTTELKELEACALLNDHLQAILNEVDRQKRLAVYEQCLRDTSTQQITRKSTELTKRVITDQLSKAFQQELSKLAFTHLAVEIQPAGGAKGELFHHLVFSNAPGVVVMDVLSEGESRALSLAAFLTELSTAASSSAIIFDDPVSSLDHVWRERIALRLVSESKIRQVIVFTHDLLFLRILMDECRREDVQSNHVYIRRDGQVGISSSDLPWVAMGIKDRIGHLHNLWQAADKLFRTSDPDAYETAAREIYALMREAWEQAVSEVLLNDVVERYRHSVETQKVRFLHDITEEDCKTLDDAMTECSRWMRGHDQPAANGTPFPKPDELNERIQELQDWVRRIRKRRK